MPAVTRLLRLGAAGALVLAVIRLPASPPAAVAVIDALPGAASYPAAVAERLARAVASHGPDYEPRTRHRNPDGSATYTNRLILEPSPYLLQHAHNPVDWYPWGDEAFERARAEKKPVLLSVGYSTCHWCHVMEEESFEDEAIAAYMNEHYVAIKVDRERRPDVDGVYMAAVQLMTGRGGWPMTVWLTPDREPFYGGTYFPPRDGVRGTRVGFLTLLERLAKVYRDSPDDVVRAAADAAGQIRRSLGGTRGTGLPDVAVLHQAYRTARGSFDPVHGGFGGAPKFPRTVQLEFLLRYHRRTGEPNALAMVERTLEAMAKGGMRDHVGGGFHRYSTDARWLVPHFEKMLYDNALLTVAYLEGYQATGRADFAAVARDTLSYVAREMTSPEGAFYSATDADSEGEEGVFFVWTPGELAAVLGPDALRLVTAYYAVTPAGNFEGRNVLHTPRPLAEVARELEIEPAEAERQLAEARARLLAARSRREPPLTDRKILTSWNGLMISAFARGARILHDPALAQRAARAAELVLSRLERAGRLQRSALGETTSGAAYLDDYAFFVAGLLDLFEATGELHWLREAIRLEAVQRHHFADPAGGFFFTADDHEELVAREKPSYDGAEPSGNSVALLNALRLYELTTDARHRETAEAGLRAFAPVLAGRPTSAPRLLSALDFLTDRPKEIVIVTPNGAAAAEALLARLRMSFVPNSVLAVVREGPSQDRLAGLVPLVEGKLAQDGRPTAYVCERQVCDLPTASPDVFARQIARVEPLPDGAGG